MTRDELAALERALREAEPPDAGPARERARRTVLAQAPRAAPARRRAAPLVWAALAAVLAAFVVTQRDSGPAQAVERLVRDIVSEPRPAPAPVSRARAARCRTPAGQRVRRAVRRRPRRAADRGSGAGTTRPGRPRGLFVARDARDTRSPRSIPPTAPCAGACDRAALVGLPRWAPDGKHIAYRAGRTLRIVYGNGDARRRRRGVTMAPVAPAWRPSEPHTRRVGGDRRHRDRRGRRHRQGPA